MAFGNKVLARLLECRSTIRTTFEKGMSGKNDQILSAQKRTEIAAAQFKVLLPLKNQIENVMESNKRFSVIFFDTQIYETHNSIDVAGGWLTGALAEWLEINAQILDTIGHDALYRIVLLPYPHTVANLAKRQLLVDYIRLIMHVHLWHGVICPVYFVDPKTMPDISIISKHIFVAMPKNKIFIPMPNFFRADSAYVSTLEGSQAIKAIRDAFCRIGLHRRKPIWLFYDEDNFQDGEKLSGWRWKSQRQFFHALYGTTIHCLLCHSAISHWCLDHIAPYALGFSQTLLNFQPLCRECNSAKGTLPVSNPRKIPLFIPPTVESQHLTSIVENPPPWLGKRRMKRTKESVTGWFRDLM